MKTFRLLVLLGFLLTSVTLVCAQDDKNGEDNTMSLEDMMRQMKQNDTIYKVQFFASKKHIPKFKDVEDVFGRNEYVTWYKYEGMYRYTFGEVHNDPKPAIELKTKFIELGYKDSFVVAFKNGKRLFNVEIYKKVDF